LKAILKIIAEPFGGVTARGTSGNFAVFRARITLSDETDLPGGGF
jgi:hypothetical protein